MVSCCHFTQLQPEGPGSGLGGSQRATEPGAADSLCGTDHTGRGLEDSVAKGPCALLPDGGTGTDVGGRGCVRRDPEGGRRLMDRGPGRGRWAVGLRGVGVTAAVLPPRGRASATEQGGQRREGRGGAVGRDGGGAVGRGRGEGRGGAVGRGRGQGPWGGAGRGGGGALTEATVAVGGAGQSRGCHSRSWQTHVEGSLRPGSDGGPRRPRGVRKGGQWAPFRRDLRGLPGHSHGEVAGDGEGDTGSEMGTRSPA